MAKDFVSVFAAVVNRKRISLGWTRKDLAMAAKLSETTAGAVCRGGPVDIRTATKTAAALGLPASRVIVPYEEQNDAVAAMAS